MRDLGIQVLFQGNNFLRLLQGLAVTIAISLVAVIISIVLGIGFGILMVNKNPIIKIITKIYFEFIRIMPQLVLLFIVYFGMAKTFNINISGVAAAVIAFSMWGIAEMGDLVRGALTSIPRHQYETGKAIGLTKGQIYYHIIIPQIMRRLVPQSINLVTRMIKTTSLIALIGVVELIKTGQQIIEEARLTLPTSALWIYALILLMYFIICYPISRLSSRLELMWKE